MPNLNIKNQDLRLIEDGFAEQSEPQSLGVSEPDDDAFEGWDGHRGPDDCPEDFTALIKMNGVTADLSEGDDDEGEPRNEIEDTGLPIPTRDKALLPFSFVRFWALRSGMIAAIFRPEWTQ